MVAIPSAPLLLLRLPDMKRIESTGKTRRVLLVDDNKNGTPARKAALEEHGYETASASSPIEALEIFQQSEYDLVVTDYRMPKMNGAELIEALRKLRSELPIILLSGFAETGGLSESSTGANVVLQKGPTEGQQLVRAVNRLLHHRASRKPAAAAGGKPPLPKRLSH
jgi:CheY-like chemotaxis protein